MGQTRENLGPWKGKLKGKKLWIVGSGPSLDDVDVGLLAGRHIFALNGAIQLFVDRKRYPDAWWLFWDLRAFNQIWPHIEEDWGVIRAIVHKRAMENTRHLRCSGRFIAYVREAFPTQRTVIETALLIGDYMGYDEIYLAGVDFAAKIGQAYHKPLEWKPCHFWDRKGDPARCGSFRTMLKAIQEVLKKLKTPVFQTSPIFPDKKLMPYVDFEEAIRRTNG